MSDVLYNEIEPAANLSQRVQAYYTPNMPYITAAEVMAELDKRLGDGKQYTTFPNKIRDAEKAKLTAEGYVVTENTIDSENRDGAGDLYIGFQVALNATAASGDRLMVISQKETNGIDAGGGGGGGGSSAASISYDNSQSGLPATTVQEALDSMNVTKTQEEYDALSDEEKNNGTYYFIAPDEGA